MSHGPFLSKTLGKAESLYSIANFWNFDLIFRDSEHGFNDRQGFDRQAKCKI
jgi:hypothetical protein